MPIDGSFGLKTKAGYIVLREKLGLVDIGPGDSAANFRIWLDLIARHGMADKPAGTFFADEAMRADAAAASD